MQQEEFQEPFEYLKNGVSAKNLREKLVIDREEITGKQMKRKILYGKLQEGSAILQLSKLKHWQLAVKWSFGRFPLLSTSLLEEKFGEKIPRNLNALKTLLSRYRLSEEERTVTEASLDHLLFMIWSSP